MNSNTDFYEEIMIDQTKHFDKFDHYIIEELSKDFRVSASAIALSLGIIERTVRRRISKLIESGAIRLTTIVNPSKFGYHSIADFNLQITEEEYDTFVEICKNNPNINYIALGGGIIFLL